MKHSNSGAALRSLPCKGRGKAVANNLYIPCFYASFVVFGKKHYCSLKLKIVLGKLEMYV